MTGRSRLFAAVLAMLMIVMMAGCTVTDTFKRTQDGRVTYTEGNNTWKWERSGGVTQITLNDKLFAVLQNGQARVTLPDTVRTVEVTLDNAGNPVSVKTAWGVVLTQADYATMNTAFFVNTNAGGQTSSGSVGWVIFLLIVVIAGVLLFVYAGSLVNSWKLGGIFGGNDTAKSLLIVRAIGVAVVVLGVILLLVVIF